MDFTGKWNIIEMEMWDEDYFNMEVQANIEVKENGQGEFQFGLVHGYIDGKVVKYKEGNKFEFSWEGNDEMEEVNGNGWIRLKDNNKEIEGEFRFFEGDNSTFLAIKVD